MTLAARGKVQEVEGRWPKRSRGVRSGWSQGGRDRSDGAGSRAERAPHRHCAGPHRSVRTPFDFVNNALQWDFGSAGSSNKLFFRTYSIPLGPPSCGWERVMRNGVAVQCGRRMHGHAVVRVRRRNP